MVHGMPFESVLDQSPSWLGLSGFRCKHTLTSFKASEHCEENICHCSEGYRCIQTFPIGAAKKEGVIDDFSGEPQWIMGCPVTRSGHDIITTTSYNKENVECKPDKCTCVLNKEPNGGLGTDVIRVPTVTGDPKSLLKRFSMPNLTDQYVNSVTKKDRSNSQPMQPAPMMLDADDWKLQFPNIKDKMKQIMDYLTSEMKVVEADTSEEKKQEEAATKPGAEVEQEGGNDDSPPILTPSEKDGSAKTEAGDVIATSIIDQFNNFQKMCAKLEDTAQELGLANQGEAGDLNCHLDYKEKKAVNKALEDLVGAVAKTKVSSAPVDAWTVGPCAALAHWPQFPRTVCKSNATTMTRQRTGTGSVRHRQLEDFIAPRSCRASKGKTAKLEELQQFFTS